MRLRPSRGTIKDEEEVVVELDEAGVAYCLACCESRF